MWCSSCPHRKWEEGDHSETPPGYGVYYCDLVPPPDALPMLVAYGKERPNNCPLIIKGAYGHSKEGVNNEYG